MYRNIKRKLNTILLTGMVLLWSICFSLDGFGQNEFEDKSEKEEPEIFTIVEQMPEFPGGESALTNFIQQQMIYPHEAKDKDIQGVVVLNFVVEKDGRLSNIEILRDIGSGCGNEAVRIVEQMPNWSAGQHRGQPVLVAFKLPVRFKLKDHFKDTRNNNYSYSLGFTAGMQSPYALGGEFSYMLGKNIDVNAGIGFGFGGLKMGVGARLFLANKEISPYIGINLIHAPGLNNLEVANKSPISVFDILSDQALHIKGGLKWNIFYNQNLYITGGYAIARNGYEAQYISGFYNEANQNVANLFAIGGLQISFTYVYGFKPTKQTEWEGDSWGK